MQFLWWMLKKTEGDELQLPKSIFWMCFITLKKINLKTTYFINSQTKAKHANYRTIPENTKTKNKWNMWINVSLPIV